MKLTQKTRLGILLLYAGLLFSVCRFLFNSWIPPSSEKGLWLYASLANLLLGTLLLSPYFTKPADAVSDAVVAALAMPTVHAGVVALHREWLLVSWKILLTYFILVIVVGTFAMLARGAETPRAKQLGETLYVLSTQLGQTSLVFSLLFLYALLAFHHDDLRQFLILAAVWVVVVPARLFERTAELVGRMKEIWVNTANYESLGVPHARKEPSVILLRRTGDVPLRFGQVLTMAGPSGAGFSHTMVIDELRLAEEQWIRCFAIDGVFAADTEKELQQTIRRSTVIRLDGVVDRASVDAAFGQCPAYSKRAGFVGLVAANTDISTLRFEIVRTDLAIGEGQLVEVLIAAKPVLYQIINGLTQEEILNQKNTYGFALGSGKKIGTWNGTLGRFEHVRWIPRLNDPVLLQETVTPPERADAIGFFPGTAYPVSINVQQLVTHNAAILGILGAGKTFLALELVERMLLEGIKVIALDLTNQYETELAPYYSAATEQPLIDALKATGPPGRANVKQNVAEGGSVEAFRGELRTQLTNFSGGQNALLKIYNPTIFEVWRQDSKPFSGQASMAQLTPTEIARIVTELALEICSTTVTDRARLCIVYEEAHSLIPEWNAVASEGDKAATNGTAKAILQGRKYGLGCLVVTQRTANVTKTILNQCNTVFALRVFDSTGMEFLRNYIGDDYSSVLSTLEDRHAVVFGRASSCSDPVLVRLNDRQEFLRLNRRRRP
jgi:hypothetical protein